MAQLLDGDLIHVSFPITKFEEDGDGNLIVEGTVTDGTVDSDKQIVDPVWSAKALQSWMESGPNVRVMHSPHLLPAGRGLQVDLGDNAHKLRALVVEPVAQKLVRNKVLRAYSVGIANPVIKRDPLAMGGRIVGGDLAEVSLVDRPANKNCQLVLAKSADLDVPWTYGDLEAILTKAETVGLTKGDKPIMERDVNDDDDDDVQNDAVADGDSEPDDEDDVTKSYSAARAAWLAREPRIQSGDIPTGTAFLAKMAARDAWQKWDAEGEAEGLNGTADGYAIWLAKRDVRPEVGGGTDVDKMPAEDFVDPKGRRFPIHSPGDVSDAVSSYGRAKPLIPMQRFRKRLTAIAHRKGSAFVAELPESWGEGGAEKNITTSTPLASGLVPFNLQGQHADDEKDDVAEADLTKRGKRLRCEKCGSKLRKSLSAEKGHPHPGQRYSHGWVPRPGMEGMPRTRALQKPFNVQTHHAGTALMEAQRAHTQGVPHHEIAAQLRRAADDLASKKLAQADILPTGVDRNPDRIRRDDVARLHHIADMYHPTAKAQGGEVSKRKQRLLPDDVAPMGHHREPDGDAVEDLEADAGMTTTPDATPDQIPESVKGKKPFPGAAKPFGKDDDPDDDGDDDSDEPDDDDDDDSMEKGIGDPYTVKRLHDALCAAYDWQSVTAAYPAMGNLTDALISNSLGGALAADVRALRKAFGSDLLDEARAAVHKSFADMYPTAHPTPTTVTPGQFQRPYISAGHAPLNASGGRANSVPPGSHVPHPDDFDRGLITEGHQAESPGDRGDNNPTGSVATGSGAAMYASAAKTAALNAMRSMHDHIAAALPDMCPMASSKFELPADMGATSRPVSSTGFAVSPAPGEVSKAAGFTRKQLSKMIRSAVLEATAPQKARIAALQAEIEELGAQPDPTQAPMRGVVRSKAAASDPTPSTERVSLVEKAQQAADREKTDQIAYLTRLANLGNPNIAQREQAEALLSRLIAS